MASYQDLLDAIARVRAATGNRDAWKNGLSGADIAAACSALSSPSALGDVLTKIVATHPRAFLAAAPAGPPPGVNEGLAAEAIRGAETALAQQNSTAAQVDLQVVTAVLNAHAANADGAAELNRLQREIESAVLSRTDLDTPAGARQFQRFLIGKLRDIRTVIDTGGLDATSKAALAAALASLYASATPQPAAPAVVAQPGYQPAQEVSAALPTGEGSRGSVGSGESNAGGLPRSVPDTAPWELDELPPLDFAASPAPPIPEPWPATAPPSMPAPAMPIPAMAAPATTPSGPAWGGGLPGGLPFGGGGLPAPTLPDPVRTDPVPAFERHVERTEEPLQPNPGPLDPEAVAPSEAPSEETSEETSDEPTPADPSIVHLPDGQTVRAPSPQVAAAVTAAIAGMPIADAFRQQGITLPAPGTAVTDPVEVTRLMPGDLGVLADRHALALGNGQALLDDRIRPIADVIGPGFLGWQQPPAPTADEQPRTPEVPAATRPAETAPS